MPTKDELRPFLARLLGWASDETIDAALRSIDLAANHRAHLVLQGAGDLVPIAQSLHRRVLGVERPFVVCDPRRGNKRASVRSPANLESSVDAFRAASGGSLCVRRKRLPEDFSAIVPRLRRAHDVQYIIVCSNLDDDSDPLLVLPAPIQVPLLANRTHELGRIVDEYAADALAALHARDACFTTIDRTWIVEHATSLTEIEKTTVRVVALRMSRNVSDAAARLDMAPVSLWRWLLRRNLRTFVPID